MALEIVLLSPGFNHFLLLRDEQNSNWVGVLAVIKCIYLPPTYLHFIQDIEDRCLLLTSSMNFVDLPKSRHIFIMSKIRHSHRKYDMRKWCGIKDGPNWAMAWLAGHITLASWPCVGAFPKTILSTCPTEAVLKVSNGQRRCKEETCRPAKLHVRPT
jgi:hypothetical protein